MARASAQDLRDRVINEAEASSARRAAAHFGVGAATAVRWAAQAHAGQTASMAVLETEPRCLALSHPD